MNATVAKNKTTAVLFALPANVSLLHPVTIDNATDLHSELFNNEFSTEEPNDNANAVEYTMMVMIIGVGGYMLFVISLMAWCSWCRSRRKAAVSEVHNAADTVSVAPSQCQSQTQTMSVNGDAMEMRQMARPLTAGQRIALSQHLRAQSQHSSLAMI
jgi:hypothetical protein